MSQVLDPDAVSHPHDLRVGVPDRLPAAVIRELSRLRPGPVWRALLVEWGVIAATIALCTLLPWSAWLYPLAVIVIGSRQVALTVLAHDAAHQRMFDHRVWNDVIGGMLAAWPTFITLGSFRHHHGEHHHCFINRCFDYNFPATWLRSEAGKLTAARGESAPWASAE